MRGHGSPKSKVGALFEGPRGWITLALLMSSLVSLPACGKKKSTADMATSLQERLAQKAQEVLRAKLGAGATAPRADRDDPPPALSAAAFAFQPSFTTSAGKEFQAGKLVIAKVPSAPGGLLGLSCIHIFGPDGGLSSQIASDALPAFVKKTTLIAADGGRVEIGAALAVPGARPFVSDGRSLPNPSTDLSVFRAPAELAAHALELADDEPAVGDRVWLLARLVGGAAPDVYLHPAHVRLANDKILGYEFENNHLNLTATSGAPVVNARGKIVALNIGGGLTGGKLNVFGNPIGSVHKKIEATLLAAK
jgi:hypothetical protein